MTKSLAKELFVGGISKDLVDVIINNEEKKMYVTYEYDDKLKYPNQIKFKFK